MGVNQRGGYNNEKESEKKSLFLRAFARKMKARKSHLNSRTQLFLLELLRHFPSSGHHTTQTADQPIPSDFSFEMNPLQDRDVFHLFPVLKKTGN
ncbi:hypothetical protein CEXT_319801 [Caerostris extrusa]|uniref:Uncharacterized protein n=1 Tax=Caerostris extrusa TaxID=172846 RepID=A0AAV4M433_CAEEX|nr:hypothetical protein CEXT_319801 [Caerostris extrusa]